MKKLVSLLLAAALLLSMGITVCAAPALQWESVYTLADSQVANSRVNMQTTDGVNYLFLPSDLSPEAVPLHFVLSRKADIFSIRGAKQVVTVRDGDTVDLTALCGTSDRYQITIAAQQDLSSAVLSLTVVPTRGVGSMFLVSDDPQSAGRQWVEESPTKSNKATGSMVLTAGDGSILYNNTLTQIKGRGNSTWTFPKRPYQIKLGQSADLLQTGDADNASKTWVLLANWTDPALIRNNIVYDLSAALQMESGIECQPVNLFYDGEYRGAYLLSEKVQVGTGRVGITDLEKATELANPSITDWDSLSARTGKTKNGASYVYCDGVSAPENITGGYLLEMDTMIRAREEACYFLTTRGQYVVVKSPEFCSQAQMDYIASYYQEFEDTLFNKGVNPTNHKQLSDYMDITSAAQCYIINELTKNPDSYRSSSFLYKDADNTVMRMGPVWDYDLSFGLGWGEYIAPCADPESFFTLYTEFGNALYQVPSFRQTVHDVYGQTVAPLIADTLLTGNSANPALQSFAGYRTELSQAANADAIAWGSSSQQWNSSVDAVQAYISARSTWLAEQFAKWNPDTIEPLADYMDVHPGDWFYDEVTAATSYGIMNGMGHGVFQPNGNTTRAQAVKVLYELDGAKPTTFLPRFPDVRESDWFAPAVTWASRSQIALGLDDGRFHPEDNITRQDMVVLLHRFLGTPAAGSGSLAGFTDSAAVSRYAENAMKWAIAGGVVQGYTDHTIRPTAQISRAEIAAMIVRFREQFMTE